MANQYSIAQARDHFTQLVQEVEAGEPIEITRRGKPVAVLLSLEAFQQMVTKSLFGENLESFRAAYQLEELDLHPEEIFDVRDRSIGREVSF